MTLTCENPKPLSFNTSFLFSAGDNKTAYLILISVAMVIFIGWISFELFTGIKRIREVNLADVDALNKLAFEIPGLPSCCSVWKISHLTLFFIIGLVAPDSDAVAVTLGILWEGVEALVSMIMKGSGYESKNKNVEYKTWWLASPIDIVFNIVGFYIGKLANYALNINGSRCSTESFEFGDFDIKELIDTCNKSLETLRLCKI